MVTGEKAPISWGGGSKVGNYEVNSDQINFSQKAGTMMACLEGMETEKAFLDVLKQVNRWKITGQQLELFDAAGNPLASLEARHLK
jgi:heat shock protein HslJ